jgi:hypothetical protein
MFEYGRSLPLNSLWELLQNYFSFPSVNGRLYFVALLFFDVCRTYIHIFGYNWNNEGLFANEIYESFWVLSNVDKRDVDLCHGKMRAGLNFMRSKYENCKDRWIKCKMKKKTNSDDEGDNNNNSKIILISV